MTTESIGIPIVISLVALAVQWIFFHQKIGVDEALMIRSDLRDCHGRCDILEASVVRLTAEHQSCLEKQQEQQAQYEATLEMLRDENHSLMRRLYRQEPT